MLSTSKPGGKPFSVWVQFCQTDNLEWVATQARRTLEPRSRTDLKELIRLLTCFLNQRRLYVEYVACSHTLSFPFKVHRARGIKNKLRGIY